MQGPISAPHTTFWGPRLLFVVGPDSNYTRQTQALKHGEDVFNLCLAFSEVLVRAQKGSREPCKIDLALPLAGQTGQVTLLPRAIWPGRTSSVKLGFSNCALHVILSHLLSFQDRFCGFFFLKS